MTLGERLRHARTRADMTQIEVQKRTNINSKTLSNWENNVSRPSTDDLVILAVTYGVSTDYLLGRQNFQKGLLEFSKDNEHAAPTYYNDPEVAELADRLKNQPGMHMLFDASRNMTKQDIEAVVGLIKQFKGSD